MIIFYTAILVYSYVITAAKNIYDSMPTFYSFILGFLIIALIIFGVYKFRCSEAECKRWLKAARLINNEEPRIWTEKRLINGTECNVWIWRDAEVSPMARIPDRALTRCLKLREVKFTTLVDREFIRQDLMAKLNPLVPKHVGFISGSENVVYMMLKDLDDAKSAFLAFHFQWFYGNLLSAKYLRDERYLERFPDAEE